MTRADEHWRADPAIVEKLSKDRPDIIYDEAKVPKYELPELMKSSDGSRVTTAEQWAKRRPEILELFRSQMFGRRPGKPRELRFETLEEKSIDADGHPAVMRRVAIHSTQDGRHHQFELMLIVPKSAETKPVPVFLLIDNRSNRAATQATRATSKASSPPTTASDKSEFWPAERLVARGYGAAIFRNGELAQDDPEHFREGVIRLFEGDVSATSRPADAFGALAAWGWGASRAMDYLETDPRVDAKHVAIVGHSRGGKAALWAGAEDPRFAMVVSNSSGEDGAAITRRRFGETIGVMSKRFPHWYCQNYAQYANREDEFPVDAHMLLALVAPRALYVTSHGDDLWADPRGEFLAFANSSPAYALFGAPPVAEDAMPPLDQPLLAGPRSYHTHAGKHDLTAYDWDRFLDFADTFWSRKKASPR